MHKIVTFLMFIAMLGLFAFCVHLYQLTTLIGAVVHQQNLTIMAQSEIVIHMAQRHGDRLPLPMPVEVSGSLDPLTMEDVGG